MSLGNIPVIVAGQDASVSTSSALSGNALVILREIADCLDRLLAAGETTALDLHSLPLTPADRDWLKARLGEGEISVTLQSEGESTLSETACPGVWWITHRNPQGAVSVELIEIAFVPELVKAHPQDVKNGLERLELLMDDLR